MPEMDLKHTKHKTVATKSNTTISIIFKMDKRYFFNCQRFATLLLLLSMVITIQAQDKKRPLMLSLCKPDRGASMDFNFPTANTVENHVTNTKHLRKKRKIMIENLCVSHLKDGKIELALKEFSTISHERMLANIIKKSYNTNMDLMFNVLKFVRCVPNISQMTIAYTTLLDEIKNNNNFDTPIILALAFEIQRTIEVTNLAKNKHGIKNKLNDLKIKIQPYVKSFIQKSSIKIKNGLYSDILVLDKQNWDVFKHYLPDLVHTTYGNSSTNVKPLLKFIREISWIESLGIVLSSLHYEMRKNNYLDISDTYNLASLVKQCMDMKNYTIVSTYYTGVFEKLKSNLPGFIVKLVWGGSLLCSVRNVRYSEYLYPGSWWHKDEFGRNVYTWVPGTIDDMSFNWRFTPFSDISGNILFTIQNPYYDNEFLTYYVDGDVRTMKGVQEGSYWGIEPNSYHSSSANVIIRKGSLGHLGALPDAYVGSYRREIGLVSAKDLKKQNYDMLNRWRLKCN